jgi:putative cell wall-binding protein
MFERNPNVTRVSGSNRYETAVMVSQMAYPKGAPVAYVVSGEDWPDAISAGSFNDGPTLFVTANGIPRATRNEIKRLKVKRVVVVGGEMVVSNAVLAELEMLIL